MGVKTEVPGVAVVTGSASGLGQATALAFAAAGCSGLALLDINVAGLEGTRKQIIAIRKANNLPDLKVEGIHIDVTNPESVVEAYKKVKDAFGRIDYAVQSAGIITYGTKSLDMKIEDFDRQQNINYRGLWLCVRETIKVMKEQSLDCEAYPEAGIKETRAQRGSVVNIGSGLAWLSQKGCPAYCGAKAGVSAITRSDAIDYVGDRVRVNVVMPGICDTPITTPTPEIRAYLTGPGGPVSITPMARLGLAEEVGDVCVFLAGNKASFVTGAEVAVDGGVTAWVGS